MRGRLLLAAALLLAGCLLAGGLLAAVGGAVQAQAPQQSYDLSWWTVDGGGGTWSVGGTYVQGGTAGQPDAGLPTGGTFTLAGGFWGGGAVAAPLRAIFLPLVVRSH
jgi:hypothetical protein